MAGPERRRAVLGVAALVLAGLALRGYRLGSPPLWADEAETTINALTIVATGLPVDRHLGQPLYENVMVEPWPGSDEYAFRDISYSSRGLAVYHGWLPLYATAAVLRLAGVTPEAARRGTPPASAEPLELSRWTAIPRIPALLFSALFVPIVFDLGRRTGGTGAAWAMATAAAVSGIFVWLGRQARYYSPTLALSALCGAVIWTAWQRSRRRDHLAAGLALGVLFHTNALSAVAAGLLYAGTIALARERGRALRGFPLAVLAAGTLVLPWAWWSGFLELRERHPSALRLLDWRVFIASLPSSNPVVVVATVAGVLVACVALWLAATHPEAPRWTRPLRALAPALGFAAAWTVLAWAVFVLLVPAASYFVLRLKLVVAVPGLLLLVLLVTAATRAWRASASVLLPTAVTLGLLLAARQVPPPFPAVAPDDLYEAVRQIRSWRLSPGARLYALPASQLPLTYYSGRPVQSVSAVRRSWLDRFEGDFVVIAPRAYEPDPSRPRRLADEAVRRATVEDLVAEGYDTRPRLRPADATERALVDATRAGTALFLADALRGTLLPRDRPFRSWTEFWEFYFFWFDDPAAHMGRGLVFRERARRGTAHVLSQGWVIYDCRRQPQPPLVSEQP